jgi:hypothetical protein
MCLDEDRDVMDTDHYNSDDSDDLDVAMSSEGESTSDDSEGIHSMSSRSSTDGSSKSTGSGNPSDSDAASLGDHELEGFADY